MDFREIAKITQTGSKIEIKDALKILEKSERTLFKSKISTRQFIQIQVENFGKTNNPINRYAILKSLEGVTYTNGPLEYETLKNLLLLAFEDPSGYVRGEAFYLAEWLIRSLFCKKDYYDKLLKLLLDLNARSKKHKLEAGGKIYINDLKPSPYKSIQKLFHRLYCIDYPRELLHRYGYDFSPNDEDIFEENSRLWEQVDNTSLKLHEVEFAKEIVKVTPSITKKQIPFYLFEVRLKQTGKPIKRVVKIAGMLSLYSLANAIVDAFDFDFDHCFGFYSNPEYDPSGTFYELFTDIDEVETTPGAKSVEHTKINDAWKKPGQKMYFLFDYGDGWQFEVEFKEITMEANVKYRREWECILKVGKAPEQYPPCEDYSGEF